MKRVSGYLTVYLALTLGVLLSLSLALIEGVRQNTIRLEANCIADISMDCVMAEYHRALFDRFNILALDSSYGATIAGRERVKARLEYYLSRNLPQDLPWDLLGMKLGTVSVEGFTALTDGGGSVFRKQAVEALLDDLGVHSVQEVTQWLTTVKKYELDTRDIEAEKREVDKTLASYQGKEVVLDEENTEILDFEDPVVMVEKHKKTCILQIALGEQDISGKRLRQSALIGRRLKDGRALQGNLQVAVQGKGKELTENVLFSEYLMRYLGHFSKERDGSALDYEVEYVIAGKATDAENLKSVLHKLLAMREAANATYLFADKEKCGEAEVAALAISVVLLVPELKEAFKTAILLGWAYAESVYDLRVLVRGGRIPLIKDKTSWHYGLTSILEDVWETLWNGEGVHDEDKGLCYEEYLKILLLLLREEDLLPRAMDMVEADIRQTAGNKAFRLDGCFVRVGSAVEIVSGYGYRVDCLQEKQYIP